MTSVESRRSSALGLLVGVLLGATACAPPATAGVKSFRNDLERAEDLLHHELWQPAKDACDQLIRDLVEDYARGKGARPLFGLAFAFRALAEAGLDDPHAAVWDWSVAELLSADATSFDLARFGDAGSRLLAAAAAAREHLLPNPSKAGHKPKAKTLEPPHKIESPRPSFPHAAEESGFKGRVQIAVIIDEEGKPAWAFQAKKFDLDEHTALVVSQFETFKDWRFHPAMADGVPVEFIYFVTTRYRQDSGFWIE